MKDFFQKLLESRNVQVEIGPHDLVRLRSAPPGVFVANHLYNGLDELILMRTLAEREPGPKFAGPLVISPYSRLIRTILSVVFKHQNCPLLWRRPARRRDCQGKKRCRQNPHWSKPNSGRRASL